MAESGAREFNPFDVEAVATFGETLRSCDTFGYMSDVKALLEQYLSAHPDPQRRYGGALGLKGGHGSGKTHLLSRIKAWALEEKKWTDPTVLYAKADTSSFFSVYTDLVSEDQLPRTRLEQIIFRCFQTIGTEDVERAEMTSSIASRLTTTEGLQKVLREGNLDRERLERVLWERLSAHSFPARIADVLLRVSDPTFGEKAYSWFVGEPVSNVEHLGVEVSLNEIGQAEPDKATGDVAAIHALEALAALHSFGNTPLILLIDQLEVLTRANPDRQTTVYSLIKKLMEEVGRQQGLVFFAGKPDAWDALPRDIPPRLREREPAQVGVLKEAEVDDLLRAYMGRQISLPDGGMDRLRRLSGGNVREILRICHHAYNRTQGRLEKAGPDLLVECARSSGTVADRRTLALETADKVISEIGDFQRDLLTDHGSAIDRVLLKEHGPWSALLVITATDPLSEIGSAEKVTDAVRFLEKQFSGLPALVASVGYSSEEVRDMIGKTAVVIPFEESTFEGQLRSQLLTLQSKRSAPAPLRDEVSEKVLEQLADLNVRFEELRENREAHLTKARADFVESSREREHEAVAARKISTRYELLEQFDSLEEAVAREDAGRERELMRSMLVANEATLRLGVFDRLGAMYLDLLSDGRETRAGRRELIKELRRRLLHGSCQ